MGIMKCVIIGLVGFFGGFMTCALISANKNDIEIDEYADYNIDEEGMIN